MLFFSGPKLLWTPGPYPRVGYGDCSDSSRHSSSKQLQYRRSLARICHRNIIWLHGELSRQLSKLAIDAKKGVLPNDNVCNTKFADVSVCMSNAVYAAIRGVLKISEKQPQKYRENQALEAKISRKLVAIEDDWSFPVNVSMVVCWYHRLLFGCLEMSKPCGSGRLQVAN